MTLFAPAWPNGLKRKKTPDTDTETDTDTDTKLDNIYKKREVNKGD